MLLGYSQIQKYQQSELRDGSLISSQRQNGVDVEKQTHLPWHVTLLSALETL
jgi:hypothetical protein